MTERLTNTFARLRADGRAGFIPYVMGGDPDLETSRKLLLALPDAGADVVELGFPFTDPTADGPTIAAAGQRALSGDTSLAKVLELAADFRARHADTPLILMGYANPIAAMGEVAFATAAAKAGVDGVIVVDLPPEEDGALSAALSKHAIAVIRLVTPTTDEHRLPRVLENARGFLYYVSAAGVTGSVTFAERAVEHGLDTVRSVTDLPIAVGFGVRTAEHAATIARLGDAVVVGSAIVDALATSGVDDALALVSTLASAAHGARKGVTA